MLEPTQRSSTTSHKAATTTRLRLSHNTQHAMTSSLQQPPCSCSICRLKPLILCSKGCFAAGLAMCLPSWKLRQEQVHMYGQGRLLRPCARKAVQGMLRSTHWTLCTWFTLRSAPGPAPHTTQQYVTQAGARREWMGQPTLHGTGPAT